MGLGQFDLRLASRLEQLVAGRNACSSNGRVELLPVISAGVESVPVIA